jgi:3-oxoacyl-[acyl-carrier protein] reductase
MRSVLVTGATGGLGQAIARALADEETPIALQYRSNRVAAEQLAAELELAGAYPFLVQGELASREGPAAISSAVLERFGAVDILVNNAGDWVEKPLLETTDEEWDRLLHTDLRAAYLMIRELAPGMVRRKWGRIINISSIAGLNYVPGEGLYGVAKAGINMLTKAFGVELAGDGVTVNAVAPAWTLPHDQPFPSVGNHPECAQVPNGRPGHAREVAALVRYLASDTAAHITGQILPIDGGLSAVIAKGR